MIYMFLNLIFVNKLFILDSFRFTKKIAKNYRELPQQFSLLLLSHVNMLHLFQLVSQY